MNCISPSSNKIHTLHQSSSPLDLPTTEDVIEESLIFLGVENVLEDIQDNVFGFTSPKSDQGSLTYPKVLDLTDKGRKINIWSFLRRLRSKGQIKKVSLVYTYSLLERIWGSKPINSSNVVKIFIGLLFIAMKYVHDDDYFDLEDYSSLVGLETQDVLDIEAAVLVHYLDWEVYLDTQELEVCR